MALPHPMSILLSRTDSVVAVTNDYPYPGVAADPTIKGFQYDCIPRGAVIPSDGCGGFDFHDQRQGTGIRTRSVLHVGLNVASKISKP